MGYSRKVYIYPRDIFLYMLEGYSVKKTLTLIIQRILKSELYNFDKVLSAILSKRYGS